jgi:hypothetical protein
VTPEEINAARVKLKSVLAGLESVQAKIKSFDADHDYLREFAAKLLSVAGQKKRRLERVFPGKDAGKRRWELFIDYARKMLPVQVFAGAGKPFEEKLQGEWKALHEQQAALVLEFEKLTSREVLRPAPENGTWHLLAKGPDRLQLAAFADRVRALGVVVEIAEVTSDAMGADPEYSVTARLDHPVDGQLVHVLLRKERQKIDPNAVEEAPAK